MIYFIQSGRKNGPVKIGYTEFNDASYRMQSLQVGNPQELKLLGVMEGSMGNERDLHSRFANSRIRGEWFRYTEELGAYIRANAIISATPRVRAADVGMFSRRKPDLTYDVVSRYLWYDSFTEELIWLRRDESDLSTKSSEASWNNRYAGRLAYGKTVTIMGDLYSRDEVISAFRSCAYS